ncbi:MAG: selenocysteine-specific translation elongation factor [Planctomycetota bacterium]|jgi:selenocysteine-specific elongation factor
MGTAGNNRAAADRLESYFILGTAGHIDHGKTSLIRALTGVNTDRLPEEKQRGMTIELGFAELTIDDMHFGVVDVPGHERFIKTMVAGASGIDVALLVVAADDSVMPQTVEHVDILKLLGATRMVVAVTKIDTVDAEMVGLVREEVGELLQDSPFHDAEIVAVSSITGDGLEDLRRAIARGVSDTPPRRLQPPFQVALDRVFTVAGRGTVVTGSVQRGSVGEGETLELHPDGIECRVRDLQSHGAERSAVMHGQRAAINIIGIAKQRLRRGQELATPGYLLPSRILNVEVRLLSSVARALKSASIVRLGVGTSEYRARIVLGDTRTLEPGGTAFAQLRCGEPVAAAYGRRFILRDESATTTIGGGVVLMPNARRRLDAHALAHLQSLKSSDKIERLATVLRLTGWSRPPNLRLCALAGIELADLPAALASLAERGQWVAVPGTDVLVVPAVIDDLADQLGGRLKRTHLAHPDLPGRPAATVMGWLERKAGRPLARALMDIMLKRRVFKRFGRFICHPEFAPKLSAADEKLLAAMVAELKEQHHKPESLDKLSSLAGVERKRARRLAELAAAMGELVQIETQTYMDAAADQELRSVIADMINSDGGVTVAAFRERVDSSRKHVVPYLEFLDRQKFTRREGDVRVLVDGGVRQVNATDADRNGVD